MNPLRRFFLISLVAGTLCAASGCDGTALPRFARPPPTDAGPDAGADAGQAPEADSGADAG